MKKKLGFILLLFGVVTIIYGVSKPIKEVADLTEEKAELERRIALLEEPVVFSTGKDTFVIIRDFKDFNGALLSINGGCPTKTWNYSRDSYTGIFRLPEDINSSDKVILFLKEEMMSDGKEKMLPFEVDVLVNVELTKFYCKNVREQEDLDGLPTRNKQADLKWGKAEYIFPESQRGYEYRHECK